uniref:Outer membrane transport energization protein ExbB (TC 2.C.1.1.1) n=3 Tax=unclassified Candidatus Kentrum TaxID=2643149 RepID=A0A450YC18_9GAMM|nr:MAG: outer membrane transport energization protein ExbB (TC 2.C.1.1.1) [Candidatus Kentron sp. LPFa]VFK36464.1 MAG: outer membrane transport energization protein ExbB (TC 2.C.1.1.1) [Candidatus Kentron sp. SD]VFK68464.1 MAG: outer membrane transport energization protein ExbB (TC 2.C.1.1.1) [Candidatus Kentron sp. UNK]VFK39088.1 MAG: outer membrane transport energization protein ExbB (TC 2.C.1.1.1) [Candidatus Kentron sp. SD]VFK73590.1 MAG: outer membrane transport energization protein ExbB (
MELLKQYLDISVFGILGIMSFLMIAYVIERIVFFARVEVDEYTDIHTLRVALSRHLTTIGSIASNAPYIGLLGTVFGILITFHDLSQEGTGLSASAIMLGLALALKATAAGLAVAVPATLAYNGLVRKVDVLVARWSSRQE